MDEASQKAKEAVAAALAKLPGSSAPKPAPVPTGMSMDALSQKMSEMGPSMNGTGRGRGRGRGGRGDHPRSSSGNHAARKIEIPKSDYDFESANKKFNKEDLIKEAIASGSPIGEDGPTQNDTLEAEGPERKNSLPATGKAYNKSTSFFDNISSEARDREDNTGSRGFGRQNRADEFKKNVDTFGQGNVDGGHRGRGRGGYRGRQYGGNRGYGRGRGQGGRGGVAQIPQTGSNAPATTVPTIPS
jgi:protein LSM14